MKMREVTILLFTAFFVFSIGFTALADDDKDEKGWEHENNESYEKENKAEYEDHSEGYNAQGNKQNADVTQEILTEYWNIWSRKPFNNPNNALPISTPSVMAVQVNSVESKLYCIPQNGQLLVSGEAISKILGAEAKYYSESRIVVLTKDKHELIIRADSNAAYVNRVKNPMPVKAASYENTVYLPVSVAANALGYRIHFISDKKILAFEPM